MARISVLKMEVHEMNLIVINQFPQCVRDILSTIEYSDSLRIAQALACLDLSGGNAHDKGTNNYQSHNAQNNQNN